MRAFERRLNDIMQSWEEELQAFRRRTKKSAQAWEAAKKRIPFGVNSNYRLVDPYPLTFAKRKARGFGMRTERNTSTSAWPSARWARGTAIRASRRPCGS